MDPVCFKVPRQNEQTIRAEYWDMPSFYRPFHYHKECQLTYILNSTGSLYIANSCIPFGKGDLFLLGKDLPHVFRSQANAGGSSNQNSPARAISVFFDLDQFIGLLERLPEARNVLGLLQDSRFGIKASLEKGSALERWIFSILNSQNFDQVIALIKTLQLLSNSQSLKHISPQSMMVKDPLDSRRLEEVFHFIQENYSKPITLEEVASKVSMTPSAFCRFFKKKTRKTFTNYLIETRIARACKLLIHSDFTVSEACFESGYNSTSNFHRHFRRITGQSPNEYKKQILLTD